MCSTYRVFHDNSTAQHLTFLGHRLTNPIGIAAGFDKHGDAVRGLADIGFGFVEIGSVTPAPQPGNERPRVFRLHADRALINRYGFNSVGHADAYERIVAETKSTGGGGSALPMLGINLGKNKTSAAESAEDYVEGVRRFADIADYLVINVSSPNTPGLRKLQHRDQLVSLLRQVVAARDAIAAARPDRHRVPVALKLAPDLSDDELRDVIEVIVDGKGSGKGCAVDVLIVSNTTVERAAELRSDERVETGGLSGAPLAERSTRMVERVYRLTGGRVPIVGVGGVFSGRDAYEKILSGASVVQIYTSFAWHGPPVVARIKRELAEVLAENGYKSVTDAVGKGVQMGK